MRNKYPTVASIAKKFYKIDGKGIRQDGNHFMDIAKKCHG